VNAPGNRASDRVEQFSTATFRLSLISTRAVADAAASEGTAVSGPPEATSAKATAVAAALLPIIVARRAVIHPQYACATPASPPCTDSVRPRVDPTNRNTALASAMVEELARCGVRRAAICPGSRSSPLALALLREPAIETTTIVDERSAGFFALGAGRATGVPAAVLTTSGTAAANIHPAVCEADEAAVPLLVLTADRPPELRGIGAGQTIDQLKLYGTAVRWFCEVGTHEADDAGLLHFRSVACRAFALAAGEPRPGPVHLNVSWRDPLGPESRPDDVSATSALAREGRDGGRPLTAAPDPPGRPADALVEALAERLRTDAHGLIVAGRIAGIDPGRSEETAKAIVALAAASGYPVLAEPTSGVRLGPHDRGHVIAAYEPIARARPQALEPDLIVRFGELPTCKPLRLWLADLETAQVVFDPAMGWHDPGHHAGAIVRADPALTADAIGAALGSGSREGEWARSWIAAGAAAADAIAAELEGISEPTEPGLHAALGGLYADGDLVYTASSMPIRDQEAFLPAGPTDALLLANRGANGIDGLISSGIGAAAATGRPTWIVTGDLGVFHDMNALAILRDVEPPVRIVVANNDGGGIFDFLPQADQVSRDEFEALLGTPLGIDLERVAAVHGLRYERIEQLRQLPDAAGDDAVLIDVPVLERRANADLHRRLSDVAVSAVTALG
jgi:2-succinyl-5-enolpyruvyl-6-hydroxy-3-cyclohexene-1-carboxylate synthase